MALSSLDSGHDVTPGEVEELKSSINFAHQTNNSNLSGETKDANLDSSTRARLMRVCVSGDASRDHPVTLVRTIEWDLQIVS